MVDFPPSGTDRAAQSFRDAPASGETRQAVILEGITIPTEWDDIALSYTGNNLTGVVYSLDSSPILTLSLSYTGSRLDSVVVV